MRTTGWARLIQSGQWSNDIYSVTVDSNPGKKEH